MVKIIDLNKKFGSVYVIKNLNIKVGKNEKITLFAPSGAGKTTLLNIILNIDNDYTGTVSVDTNNFSVIYQDPLLFPYKTIRENIFYFLTLRKIFSKKLLKKCILLKKENLKHTNLQDYNYTTKTISNFKSSEKSIKKNNFSNRLNNINNNKSNYTKYQNNKLKNTNYSAFIKNKCLVDSYYKWLEITNLTEYENFYPYQISGGMKQKVAIIRAFLLNPELILMDEPFKSIDFESKNKIIKHINEYYNNTTIIFTTHNIDEIPEITHKILFFKKSPLSSYQTINLDRDSKSCTQILNLLKNIC